MNCPQISSDLLQYFCGTFLWDRQEIFHINGRLCFFVAVHSEFDFKARILFGDAKTPTQFNERTQQRIESLKLPELHRPTPDPKAFQPSFNDSYSLIHYFIELRRCFRPRQQITSGIMQARTTSQQILSIHHFPTQLV